MIEFEEILVVCLLIISLTDATSNDEHPVLKTRLGKVRGSVLKSQNGKGFFAFRGIPYAQPPVKDLRFEPPVPVSKWEGELDATEDGRACIQFDFLRRKMVGDEDCLFLNVYTAQLTSSTLKPVMVWIHGGGFACGEGSSSMYGPDKLMDKDIVLVAINYRVSALGFLSTGDSVSPGNYGLLDQVQALKWIQENIDTFGGDPNSVTIFGESAGGASVIFHVISPLSKGLIHGAIAQSGSATTPWALSENPLEETRELAKILKCPTDSSEELVRCLRRRPALDIASENLWLKLEQFKSSNVSWLALFQPTIDKDLRSSAFLPDHPRRLLNEKRFNHVPVIIGITKDEGYITFLLKKSSTSELKKMSLEEIVDTMPILTSKFDLQNTERLKRLSSSYFSDVNVDTRIEDKIISVSNYFGDLYNNADGDFTVDAFVASGVPTYTYQLTYRGSTSFSSMFPLEEGEVDYGEELEMVCHADDLRYLFSSETFLFGKFNEKDKIVEDIFLTLWTNFAKTKVPTIDGLSKLKFKWNPRQFGIKPSYLDINPQPRMTPGEFTRKPEVFQRHHQKEEL